jgi:hypothetical protein
MSLIETKMITETEVKDWTDLPTNLKASILASTTVISQDLYIRTAIGEALFIELLQQIKADTLTADNIILLNGNGLLFRGVKSTLSWWVAYSSYPYLHSKVTNTGIQSRSNDEGLSISGSDLEVRKNLAKGWASYYLEQLICFLRENEDKYPLFRDATDCCTDLVTNGYSGSSGIVLDDDEDYKGITREDRR